MRTSCLSTFLVFITILSSFSQTRTITGKVLNAADSSAINEAVVVIYGTTFGTVTNSQGAFKLDLAKGHDIIAFSHVNFGTAKIKIPEIDAFSVLLKPQKNVIEGLNLQIYPYVSKSVEKQINKQSVTFLTQNAEYDEGWENFYKELGGYIVEHPEYTDELESFFRWTEFLITEEGELKDINIKPDSGVNNSVIKESLKKMGRWKPALQNKKPIAQLQQFAIYLEKPQIDEIFQIVDEPAVPIGGYEKLYEYVVSNLRYPVQARRMGIQGDVYAQFVVNKQGIPQEINIIKGIGAGCDEEVIRVISNSPKWIPARHNGVPVSQRIVMPFRFEIDGGKESSSFNNHKLDSLKSLTLDVIMMRAFGIERGEEPFQENGKLAEIEDDLGSNIFNRLVNHYSHFPSFPGGNEYLQKHIKLSMRDLEIPVPPNKFDSKVTLEIWVDTDGSVEDVKIIRGLGDPFDQEAVRIYETMPKWIPGEKDGEKIKAPITQLIDFSPIKESKKIAAARLYNKGINHIQNGNYEKSIDYFTKAIENDYTQLDFYFNKALALFELENRDNGCEVLEVIKDLDQEALFLYKNNCEQK